MGSLQDSFKNLDIEPQTLELLTSNLTTKERKTINVTTFIIKKKKITQVNSSLSRLYL